MPIITCMKCKRCSKEVVIGKTLCEYHLEAARVASKNRYEAGKSSGKCWYCKEVVDLDGKITCSTCQSKLKIKLSDRKKSGLCTSCGKALDRSKGLLCTGCYSGYCNNVNEKARQRKRAGLCRYCDKTRVGKRLCLNHYLMFTAKAHFGSVRRWEELSAIFDAQSGLCPYTGRSLTIGEDASLDHKTPKSRGGTDAVDNLQWVYMPVNFMKLTCTDEEFKDLIQNIYAHLFGKLNYESP